MTESNPNPEQGNPGIGASNQQGQAGQKPVDVGSIKKEIEGSLYSKFQSDLSKAENETKKWKRKAEEFGNVDELEKRAESAKAKIFEAEAVLARTKLIESEFPQLKGREKFIPVGSLEQMRSSASEMVQSFGLTGGQGESQKSEANPAFSSTFSRLAALPEEKLKEELKKLPTEVIKKFYEEMRTRGY